mgnify:CR=1 FL=1
MSKPILFYSKNNPQCIQLWKNLASKNKLETFIKICVDNNRKIPTTIRSVPAVFIKGRPVIYGSAIEMFLKTNTINLGKPVRDTKRVNFQEPPTLQNKLDKRPSVKTSTNGLENILDFNPVEMSANLSDSYSFIQNNPSPMDFCFQFIETSPETQSAIVDTTDNTGNKQSDLENRLQKLQETRRNM